MEIGDSFLKISNNKILLILLENITYIGKQQWFINLYNIYEICNISHEYIEPVWSNTSSV